MSLAVATRYARALADVASGAGLSAEAVLAQLKDFEAAVATSAELKTVLMTPAVAPARKRAVVAKLAEPMGLSEKVRNFLYVLIDHRRVTLLGSVAQAFETVMDERLGRVRADVTSAQALSAQQQAELVVELTRLSGKTVRPEYSIDASLVGGAVARIGSTIYDGSVRGRLDAMRRRLST